VMFVCIRSFVTFSIRIFPHVMYVCIRAFVTFS
jgi:hypothetical protein